MRWSLILGIILIMSACQELAAMPSQCPKIDQAMLKADVEKLSMNGELEMDGYRWKVSGGNLCNPTCEREYQQALQKGIKIKSKYKILEPHGVAACHYTFTQKNVTVADLIVTTDDSMKLPEHSYKQWADTTNDVDKVMEKEEEGYRDDPRIRME